MPPAAEPQPHIVRCPCGCGQILFAQNATGDAIVIRCQRGHNTELRMGLTMKSLGRTAGTKDR